MIGLQTALIGSQDGRTDGQMENLPILQDFVPYWGKGITDQLMPLGNWFFSTIMMDSDTLALPYTGTFWLFDAGQWLQRV